MATTLLDRVKRVTPRKLAILAGRRLRRARKDFWQWRNLDQRAPRTALFVVGCQRSGTDMVMDVFERSRTVRAYNEDVYSPAFLDYRLRPAEALERLFRRSTAPVIALKPVCDSHLTDRLLARHAGSRAVWMLRRWPDVVNSAVRNFGAHQRDIQLGIAAGEDARLGWRAERLPEDVRRTITGLAGPELSPEDGAALFWWTRNRFFLDLGLDRDPRVLLLRYEALVTRPAEGFQRLFDFAGCRFEEAAAAQVFATSVGRRPPPRVAPAIAALCEALEARLGEAAARQEARA